MSAPPNPFAFEVLNFTPDDESEWGQRVGTGSMRTAAGLIFKTVTFLKLPNGERVAKLPMQRLGFSGDSFAPILDFASEDAERQWNAAAWAALDRFLAQERPTGTLQ
ncbi:MAG: hypothetical protein ROZ64_16590 [Burkholderiaceae bacterium]|nr:hypothetical protein [Burkholderiaceae bacterium]